MGICKLSLDKFCGCIGLKIGCIIVGSVHLVESILYIIMTHSVIHFVIHSIENYDASTMYLNVVQIYRMLQLLLLVYSVMMIPFVCVLFVGLYKNKPSHVKAFLINDVVFTFISVLYVILLIHHITGYENTAIGVGALISILKFYFCTMIRNQYNAMEKTSTTPVIENSINAELI